MSLQTAQRPRRGFSLMELLVVVTILGVLAMMIVPRISVTALTAEQRVDEQNRALINTAIERYYIAEGVWPADLDALGNDPDYFPDGLPVSPLTGNAYSMDAVTHRVE